MTAKATGSKPGTLMKLKAWVTVPEAARYLTLAFGENVTEADVLQFGLNGDLKLSVRFVNNADATRYRDRTEAEVQASRERWDAMMAASAAAKAAGLPPPKFPKRVLTAEEEKQKKEDAKVFPLSGEDIFDLPMVGGERLDVERQYQQQTGGPEVTLIDIGGTFVDTENGIRLQLQERFEKGDKKEEFPFYSPGNYFPPSGLPDGSVLVVRSLALRDLETRVLVDSTQPLSPDATGKTLGQRERATLLTLIAALAKAAGIDLSQPSKASGQIEALTTELLGIRIPARTVENHLKAVPDALERRGRSSD